MTTDWHSGNGYTHSEVPVVIEFRRSCDKPEIKALLNPSGGFHYQHEVRRWREATACEIQNEINRRRDQQVRFVASRKATR